MSPNQVFDSTTLRRLGTCLMLRTAPRDCMTELETGCSSLYILYEGFYTSNHMYAPCWAVSENIWRIFRVSTSPLQIPSRTPSAECVF